METLEWLIILSLWFYLVNPRERFRQWREVRELKYELEVF